MCSIQKKSFFNLVFSAAVLVSTAAMADHPNEGTTTLSSLLDEARKSNLEIQESEKSLEASRAERKKGLSPFLPEVNLEGGYQKSKIDDETSNGTFGYAVGKLNLYHGGKDKNERQILSNEESFQEARLEKVKQKIEREVAKKYYTLLYLQEGIALKNEALKANKAQSDMAIRKKNAGFTSQADVLEFELREATLKSDINLLKREEAKNENELKQLIGKIDGPELRVGGHLHRESIKLDAESLAKSAKSERLELKEAQKDLDISRLQKSSLLGDYLPRLDLEGKYGKLNAEDKIYKENNNSSLMLKLTIPLFSGLETTHARQAQSAEVQKNEIKLNRTSQETQILVENAVDKIRSIEERLDLEEKNVDRSEKYYSITLQEYKKGVKNSPDVAGAAERLFDAKLRNLEFRMESYLARIELAEVVGINEGIVLKGL